MSARKVLVVEDNLVVVKELTLKLQRAGFLVDHATEAAYAKAAVHNNPPDLIILDVGLPTRDPNSPIWDGLDFLEWLHWMSIPIPVIIYSVLEPAQVKERHGEARAFAYFQKPVRFPDLLAAMEAAWVQFPPRTKDAPPAASPSPTPNPSDP